VAPFSQRESCRELVNAVCSNRHLSDVTLVAAKRKPFDALVEGLDLQISRGDMIRTCDLYVPKETLADHRNHRKD